MTLRQELAGFSRYQQKFFLLLILTGDEHLSRAQTWRKSKGEPLEYGTWYKWRQEPEFVAVRGRVHGGECSRSEAMMEFLGTALPKILSDVLELAVADWDKAQGPLKKWAMETVLGLVQMDKGQQLNAKTVVNIGQIVASIKERSKELKAGQIADASYQLLPNGGIQDAKEERDAAYKRGQ